MPRLIRSLIFFLALLALTLTVISFLPAPILAQLVNIWISRSPDPTPLPPILTAPRGEMPTGNVGLREWATFGGEPSRPVGSGFLLQLDSETVIGVTTAHAVGDLGDPANTLQKVALGIAGVDDFVIESGTLYGEPGRPRTGDDLTVDYMLLKLDLKIDPSLVLKPDSRGAPQPGERVSLFSGLGDGLGRRRIIEGTVQWVEAQGFWVLMDEVEYPGGMSGSPLVSNHTGQVVGMAIAVQPRSNRFLIGFHPIGSIVAKSMVNQTVIKISEYSK